MAQPLGSAFINIHYFLHWSRGFDISSFYHYPGVIMGTMESQISSLTIVYSTIYSGVDKSKH